MGGMVAQWLASHQEESWVCNLTVAFLCGVYVHPVFTRFLRHAGQEN